MHYLQTLTRNDTLYTRCERKTVRLARVTLHNNSRRQLVARCSILAIGARYPLFEVCHATVTCRHRFLNQ